MQIVNSVIKINNLSLNKMYVILVHSCHINNKVTLPGPESKPVFIPSQHSLPTPNYCPFQNIIFAKQDFRRQQPMMLRFLYTLAFGETLKYETPNNWRMTVQATLFPIVK